MYGSVSVTPRAGSYLSEAQPDLDPELFTGGVLKSSVRLSLLSAVSSFLDQIVSGREQWLRAWLAGSGASYRWRGSGGDLDVLLGIDFIAFRRANPSFYQMGNKDIADYLNEEMRESLWPTTRNWRGRYEVTFFANPRGFDIVSMRPYAAYDLISDQWTVEPSREPVSVGPDTMLVAEAYHQRANTAVQRYSQALTDLQNATNPAHRADAEARLRMAIDQAVSIYDTVHHGRRAAFSPTGEGFSDPREAIWKIGKARGWIGALRDIKNFHDEVSGQYQRETYGMELPSADVLIRRAMLR